MKLRLRVRRSYLIQLILQLLNHHENTSIANIAGYLYYIRFLGKNVKCEIELKKQIEENV